MKHIGRLILSIILAIAIVLIATFAVKNLGTVTVDFWPLPWKLHPPLYLVVLGPGAAGLLIGAALCSAARLRLWLRARASESRAERLARAATAAQKASPASSAGTPSTSAIATPSGRALSPRERAAADDS